MTERCLLRYFEPNAFNICQSKAFSLRFIDGTKGRGVVAERDLPRNTIIALFPGEETARIPEHRSLPASEYGRDDRELLEREQERGYKPGWARHVWAARQQR